MHLLTPGQLFAFERDYWAGKYPGQRFGQAFRNSLTDSQWDKFNSWAMTHKDIECEIFYSEDTRKVVKLIWENFVEGD